MLVDKLLSQIDEAGIELSYFPEEDRLNAKPTAALTPELVNHIREHSIRSSALPVNTSASTRTKGRRDYEQAQDQV
jgi:hypothetical protein